MYTFFFFNDTATTEIYTLSLHDALPIYFPIKDRANPTQQIRRHPRLVHQRQRGVEAPPAVRVRVAAREQEGDGYALTPGGVVQGTPAEAWHHQVRKDEPHTRGLPQRFERLEPIRRRDDLVAGVLENPLGRAPQLIVVFDHEHRFGAAPGGGLPAARLGGDGRLLGGREVDPEARAPARLAVDPDAAALLLDQAVHRGEPQPPAFPRGLGGEERLHNR